MFPTLGNLVCSKVIRNDIAVIYLAVLVGQFGLKYIDCSITLTTLFGDCTRILRRYLDRNTIGGILFQVVQIGDRIAVLILIGHFNIDIFILPGFQTIVFFAEFQLHIANLGGCAGLNLIGSQIAQEIDILIFGGDGNVLDLHINIGAFKLKHGFRCIAILIDSGAGVGIDTVAAKETVFHCHREGNDQLIAPVGGLTIGGFRTAPVFGEVKTRHVYFVAIYRSDCTHFIVVLHPLVLAGIAVGFQLDVINGCPCGKFKLRSDNVLDDGLFIQSGGRTALFDIVGNLLKDVIQSICIRSREVIAGILGRSVIGGNILHELVCLSVVCPLSNSGRGCIRTFKDTHRINGHTVIFQFLCLRNGSICDIAFIAAPTRGTVRKQNHDPAPLFILRYGIGIQNALRHFQTVVGISSATGSQCICGSIHIVLSSLRVHILQGFFVVTTSIVVVVILCTSHKNFSVFISWIITAVVGIVTSCKPNHGNTVIHIITGA